MAHPDPQVTSREELLGVIRLLRAEDASAWENHNLGRYLDALEAWLADADGYYRNNGSELDPSVPSWQLFADALRAAKVYE